MFPVSADGEGVGPGRRPRLFQAYGVGLHRSGTLSLSRIFGNYRSAHEFQMAEVREAMRGAKAGSVTPAQVERLVARRDAAGWLEMDSSGLNYWFLGVLARRFPEAKFVFTVRDCYSWCDSMLDQMLNHGDERFPGGRISPSALLRRPGPVLGVLLTQWAQNEAILRRCPPRRSLVLRVDDLSSSLGRLAGFIGVDPRTLRPECAHSNRSARKHRILRRARPSLLADVFRGSSSSPLMRRYFPGLTWEGWLEREAAARPPRAGSRAAALVEPEACPAPLRPLINFWLNQAEAAASSRREALARRLLARAEGLRPEPDELKRLAVLYRRLGEPGRAVAALRRFLQP